MSMLNLLRLIRFNNLLIIAITGLVVVYFNPYIDSVPKTSGFHLNTVILLLMMMTQGAAGNIINDYFDIKVDTLNKPQNVIIESGISKNNALLLYLSISALSFFLAGFLSFYFKNLFFVIVTAIYQVLLVLYSARLQKIPFIGNLSVALMTMGVIPVSFSFVHFSSPSNEFFTSPFFYVLLGLMSYAFIINLLREIVKDVEDLHGDRESGYNTLPVIFELHTIKKILLIGLLALVIMTLCITIFLIVNNKIVLTIPFVLMILLPLIVFIRWVTTMENKVLWPRINMAFKLYMLLGIVFFIITSYYL